MPPFKTGLHKRKLTDQNLKKEKETPNKNNENVSESEEDPENLLGEINDEGDSTDSEHDEQADANSDTERDQVVFDEEYDSTFEEEEGADSEASSELTDSEADDESEEGDDSDDDDEKSAHDSGIEQANNKHHTDNTGQSKASEQTSLVPVQQKDEYESEDTSDEEGRVNTRGDVPAWWYHEYQHVGYDLDGRRIVKPPQRDHIDDFLKKCSDPEFWRTVRDPSTGQDVVLSAKDLQLIADIRSGRSPLQLDTYEPWVEWFSREVLDTPVRAFPEHKRSFLPSRDEQLRIAKIVHALKMGWTKTRKQLADERRAKKERKWYNLWGSADSEASRGIHKHIAAPRRALPGHAESYNPPPEYLLDAKELKEWHKLETSPWKRKYTFLPQRHGSLRAVAACPRYVRERFLRCLDLYLAPRAVKMRLTISPSDLVPRLPSPRDLQPFPSREALCFRGHVALVRTVDFDASGQYALSGSDDCTLKVWETRTGRCLRTVRLEAAVRHAAWSPAGGLTLLACAVDARVLLVNPGQHVGAHRAAATTDLLLREPPPQHDVTPDERTASCCEWERVSAEQWARGVRLSIRHFKPVLHVSWHSRGDYLVATLQEAQSRSVVVHQLSRRRSQLPFRRAPGLVSMALFHPTRPLLYVATQRVVRVYDLVKQVQVRKLVSGAQWISHMAIHPAGDNLLVSTYDRKCVWFDLELSAKPYQTLRLHGTAVRCVAFSARYPLFASGGDDAYIVVSHGMVYNDLLQNPLLVPLKQLPAPPPHPAAPCEARTLALRWHPAQPWLLAAHADHTLRLYA